MNSVQKNGSVLALAKRADFSIAIATTVLFVFFSFITKSFFSSYNLFNVFRTSALYIFIALTQAIVVVIGGMNLSVGAIGAFVGMVTGLCLQNLGLPLIATVPIAFLVGMLVGLVNGIIIVKLKLSGFIVTLAMSFVLNGLVTGITKGFPFTNLPEEISGLGRGGIGMIPYVMILAIVALLLIAYMFRYTVFGRRVLATGGNVEAARLSGINTDRIVLLCNVISGFFSAAAALLWISRTGSIQANLGGDWMMVSFSVTFLGATSQKGGVVYPLGLFFAGIMITLIKNGLTVANVDVYFEQVFLGLIILFAVALDSIRGLLSARAKKM